MELTDENSIRVSCASFARIKFGDKYLLLKHGGNARKGKLMYMPIGGGLHTRPGIQTWLDEKVLKWDKYGEFRFRIKKEDLQEFEKLFEDRNKREFGVSRETWEELVLEEGLVDFSESQVKETFSHTYKTFAAIWDQPWTRYIFETFDVELPRNVMYDLSKYAYDGDERVILATESEILNRKTSLNQEIGDSARGMITTIPLTNLDINKKPF